MTEVPSDVAIERVWLVEATYAPDAAETRGPFRARHLARLLELRDAGVIIETGAFLDVSSSVMLIRAADEAAALRALGELAEEGARARARDGAEVVDQLLAIHADAGVGNRQSTGRCVGADADRQRCAIAEQLRLGDGLVAQPVAGVRAIRDQLAQEDVALRIDRMHHQAQQLGHLGLEGVGLGGAFSCGGHVARSSMS
jgi:uncharacterized protein YciI